MDQGGPGGGQPAGLQSTSACAAGHAAFWDNQQTESGLSQYQQEAVKAVRGREPGHQGGSDHDPYPEYQQRLLLTAVQSGNGPDVSTVDQIWNAAFAEAGAIVSWTRWPRRPA
jgi:ABC-type glycerol-3-phosphate transport system substrate-binding protein